MARALPTVEEMLRAARARDPNRALKDQFAARFQKTPLQGAWEPDESFIAKLETALTTGKIPPGLRLLEDDNGTLTID